MSTEWIDIVLTSVILLSYCYYILASGTEKSFRYLTEKDKRLLTPTRVFIATVIVVILTAISVGVFKGVATNKTSFITPIVLMLMTLSNFMFAEGYKLGKSNEKEIGEQ